MPRNREDEPLSLNCYITATTTKHKDSDAGSSVNAWQSDELLSLSLLMELTTGCGGPWRNEEDSARLEISGAQPWVPPFISISPFTFLPCVDLWFHCSAVVVSSLAFPHSPI